MFARIFASVCRLSFAAVLGMLLLLGLTGCWKKSGEAVVIEKDYVPAIEIIAPPNESPSPTASEILPSPSDTDESAEAPEEYTVDDTIGPPLDPRASDHEQWIVSVVMVNDRKRIDVRLERPRWEALRHGDRVHVTYREGKYTGTVWSAAID